VYQPEFIEAAEALNILDKLGITRAERLSPREQARRSATGRPQERTPSTPSSSISPLGGEEPEIRIAVQESTNKMFVLATKAQHQDIAEIMKYLNQEPDELSSAIRIYPLENREPDAVAGMLEELLESEKKDVKGEKIIPGKEDAPIIVALEDIFAIAVRGSKKQHEEIELIIEQLDKRLPQVLVEAILVQVNSSGTLDLGVALQDFWGVESDRKISGISPFGISAAMGSSGIVAGTGGTIAFFDSELVYATIEALETKLDGKVVSKPRILVNDNETANITSQREEPTTETTIQAGSDTPVVSFKEYVSAGTTLSIQPNISEGEFLKLTITLNVDSFDGKGSGNIPPAKQTNSIDTIITVPDGKTIILGGLTSQNNSTTVNKIPLLGDIPLLGALFRNTSQSESEGVLYVFVRADIVRSMGPDENFEDLDRVSEPYRRKLKDSETKYNKLPLIPGIPAEAPKDGKSALDD
jgi:type II secretory pathway component GspD/PulD (secretin)